MANIPPREARELIKRTFNEFTQFLERNSGLLNEFGTPYSVSFVLRDLRDWQDTGKSNVRDELFDGLSAEGYNVLLEQCFELRIYTGFLVA